MDHMIPAGELEYWAALGSLERVKQAYAKNPDVNVPSDDGYTPLHAAAENEHMEVLVFLVEHGADLNPQMSSGHTPLDLAELAGAEQAVTYLAGCGGAPGF